MTVSGTEPGPRLPGMRRVFIAVSVGPGLTAATRTPVALVSAHTAWVKDSTNAFEAA
ncbi:hypothetical protein GCM10010269_15800 [Streptomyces humidus]|uniref:Uncharacterized protein n=1 Tax=Streptomyces humidus TaxID=52259 RepID=A0A918FT41_9ACTN|nr:hypothetical protein GCM10010269_15800 [Streptomyces humidus]